MGIPSSGNYAKSHFCTFRQLRNESGRRPTLARTPGKVVGTAPVPALRPSSLYWPWADHQPQLTWRGPSAWLVGAGHPEGVRGDHVHLSGMPKRKRLFAVEGGDRQYQRRRLDADPLSARRVGRTGRAARQRRRDHRSAVHRVHQPARTATSPPGCWSANFSTRTPPPHVLTIADWQEGPFVGQLHGDHHVHRDFKPASQVASVPRARIAVLDNARRSRRTRAGGPRSSPTGSQARFHHSRESRSP